LCFVPCGKCNTFRILRILRAQYCLQSKDVQYQTSQQTERESEKGIERQTETEKDIDRQREKRRQKHIERHRQTARQLERHKETDRERTQREKDIERESLFLVCCKLKFCSCEKWSVPEKTETEEDVIPKQHNNYSFQFHPHLQMVNHCNNDNITQFCSTFLTKLLRGGRESAPNVTLHSRMTPSIEQICSRADKALFASVDLNPLHVMSHFFPPRRRSVHALRPRVHDRVLLEANDRMHRTFLNRM